MREALLNGLTLCSTNIELVQERGSPCGMLLSRLCSVMQAQRSIQKSICSHLCPQSQLDQALQRLQHSHSTLSDLAKKTVPCPHWALYTLFSMFKLTMATHIPSAVCPKEGS